MVNSRTLAPLLIALCIALGACDDAPQTVARRQVDGAWSLAQGVMKDAPLLVIVQGQPFEASAAQLETRVMEIMTDAVTWTQTPRLTTDRAQALSQTLRIVITFNPLQGTNAHEQCTGQSRGGGPASEGPLRIIGTFCDAATILVTVTGNVRYPDDLDDPRFAALVRQMTLDMLSPQQPSP